jgi:hypothetical protein
MAEIERDSNVNLMCATLLDGSLMRHEAGRQLVFNAVVVEWWMD